MPIINELQTPLGRDVFGQPQSFLILAAIACQIEPQVFESAPPAIVKSKYNVFFLGLVFLDLSLTPICLSVLLTMETRTVILLAVHAGIYAEPWVCIGLLESDDVAGVEPRGITLPAPSLQQQ